MLLPVSDDIATALDKLDEDLTRIERCAARITAMRARYKALGLPAPEVLDTLWAKLGVKR